MDNTCVFKATAVKEADGFDFSRFGRRNRNNDNEKPKDSTNTTTENSKEAEESTKKIVVTAWYTPQISVNQGLGVYWG